MRNRRRLSTYKCFRRCLFVLLGQGVSSHFWFCPAREFSRRGLVGGEILLKEIVATVIAAGVAPYSAIPKIMQSPYPQFVLTDENAPQAWRPQGWTGRFYRLFNRLRFVRKELRLSDDVSMVETDFREGHIKVGGAIAPDRLTIGFYRSSRVSRLSGKSHDAPQMAIAYNGGAWDAVSRAPASGVVVSFDENSTRAIVSPRALAFLMEAGRTATGARPAYVCRPTAMGEKLERVIRSSIQFAENDDGSGDRESLYAWIGEDVRALAACVIDDIADGAIETTSRGEANRYALAVEIEKLLWIDPETTATPSLSLDDVALQFECSRRQVQMAILEHFGVGFTELKRCIRLQQAFDAVNGKDRYLNISSIAHTYEFDHLGRFAKYYKDMFGVLPSRHLREAWRTSPPGV